MDTAPTISQPRKPAPPPEEARLDVGQFDNHGTSRAQLHGRSIEVQHGIPGEVVDGLVYGRRRRWARIVDVVEPAPDRVAAPCPHFHRGCGGCQWQMLSYESQVQHKIRNVESEMADAGVTVPVAKVHTMEEPWRYRVTAALSLGRHAGFRRHGTQSIVSLDDCPISHPLIGRLAASLNQAMEAGMVPNFSGQVAVEVRVVEKPNGGSGLHTCIVPTPGSRHARIESILPLARTMARFDPVIGIMYRHRQEPAELLYGDPFGVVHIKDQPFAVTAAAFFQTNMGLLSKLVDCMLEESDVRGADRVIDIYGGVGTFGLLLAHRAGNVIEIELDPTAIETARLSVEMQKLENVDLVAGTAEAVMRTVDHADMVIVDPPRAGLTPQVIDGIAGLRPGGILYVSCLARSLARDIVALKALGYATDGIDVFDFYPQTYHVELFTVLRLQGG